MARFPAAARVSTSSRCRAATIHKKTTTTAINKRATKLNALRDGKKKAVKFSDPRPRRNPSNEIERRTMPQEPEDQNRFYVIEKLLDKRLNSEGNEEYLVRWLNYLPEHDSWEPKSEIERNASDMIKQFNKTRADKPFNESRDEFDLHCICRKPYTFDQGGMIQCFNCLTWFHFSCLYMNMEEANSYAKYYCSFCKEVNPSFKCVLKEEKLNTFYGIRYREQLSIADTHE